MRLWNENPQGTQAIQEAVIVALGAGRMAQQSRKDVPILRWPWWRLGVRRSVPYYWVAMRSLPYSFLLRRLKISY